jgi:hypothetical protein
VLIEAAAMNNRTNANLLIGGLWYVGNVKERKNNAYEPVNGGKQKTI